MNKQDKLKWSRISKDSWDLAKDAYEKEKAGYEFTNEQIGLNQTIKKGDAFDYIWQRVHDYGYNEYETGVLGQWACDNLEKLRESKI